MRYELGSDGYISKVFFGCHSGNCTLYEGTIPSGYSTLEEWSEKANIQAYKIVNGQLVYDSARNNELRTLWNIQDEEDKIKKYIYERGANNNGSWIKYVDGTMEVWQRYAVNFSGPTEWGSMYAYSITNILNYPQAFIDIPAVSVTLSADQVNGWLCTNAETGVESTSRPCGYQLVRPTKKTPGFTCLHVIAKGRWKL